MLVIGIGGSALGPQLVADALAGPAAPMAIAFLDNTDPDGMENVLAAIGAELATTLAVVISKSGGTAETRNGMLDAEAAFARAGLDIPATRRRRDRARIRSSTSTRPPRAGSSASPWRTGSAAAPRS